MGYHPVPATCQISEIPPARFTVRRARKHSSADAHSIGVKILGLGCPIQAIQGSPGHPGHPHVTSPPPLRLLTRARTHSSNRTGTPRPLLLEVGIVYAHTVWTVQYSMMPAHVDMPTEPGAIQAQSIDRTTQARGTSRHCGRGHASQGRWSLVVVVVVADSHSPSHLTGSSSGASELERNPRALVQHFHPRKHQGSRP